MGIEFTNDDIKCISMFESLTGASVRDCVLTDNAVVFLVAQGDLGRAIGKKGSNITRVRQAFNRQVLVFEDKDDLEQFIRELLAPIPVTHINIHENSEGRTVYVTVDDKDRGSAIGKSGERIKIHRLLLNRKFHCDLRLNSR